MLLNHNTYINQFRAQIKFIAKGTIGSRYGHDCSRCGYAVDF